MAPHAVAGASDLSHTEDRILVLTTGYRSRAGCGSELGALRGRPVPDFSATVTTMTEGLTQGRWALLDYTDCVIHVFHPTLRQFYQLERLWGDAKPVNLEVMEGVG